MAQQSEASVEEILESIKKVIARDNREGAAEMRRQREEDAARVGDVSAEAADDEILDLSEMDIDDEAGDGWVEAETDLGGDDFVDGDEKIESSDIEVEDTPLITDEVRGAMQENLAALAMLAEPGARPQIVRSGETSLEGLTRELLRPMLAEWLDRNLPSMVEKLVRAEIARIAGKKR